MVKVKLMEDELDYLESVIKKGHHKSRVVTRARILLLTHEGKKDVDIVDFLGVSRITIWRTKKRYFHEGLESALEDKPRSGQPRKYTEKHEAEIIAHACTAAPKGRKRWSIQLLVEALQKKKGFETINRESVRLVLKKAKLSLG